MDIIYHISKRFKINKIHCIYLECITYITYYSILWLQKIHTYILKQKCLKKRIWKKNIMVQKSEDMWFSKATTELSRLIVKKIAIAEITVDIPNE